MKSPINSEKHIIQTSPTEAGFGANFAIPVAKAVAAVTGQADEVRVGALIKAVYVELWFQTGDNQPGSTTTMFEKLVSGQDFASIGDMNALHQYPNKKNVFETHQGLIGDANSNPMPLFRGWIKIPKGKQRIGLGDQLVLNVAGLTTAVTFCGLFIYKEYF